MVLEMKFLILIQDLLDFVCLALFCHLGPYEL